jgi:hypothetical protein
VQLSEDEKRRIYLEEKARLEAQEKVKQEREGKQALSGCGGCLVIFVVLILLVGLITSGGKSGSDSEHTLLPTKTDAWVMAQGFVRKNLKAPATADFPWYSDEYVTDLGNQIFQVAAYVDAENSFGAKIRSKFICKVKYVGNDNWVLRDIEIY